MCKASQNTLAEVVEQRIRKGASGMETQPTVSRLKTDCSSCHISTATPYAKANMPRRRDTNVSNSFSAAHEVPHLSQKVVPIVPLPVKIIEAVYGEVGNVVDDFIPVTLDVVRKFVTVLVNEQRIVFSIIPFED